MTSPPRPGEGAAAHDDPVDWDAEEEAADRAALGGRRGGATRPAGARRGWWVFGTVAVILMSAMAVWFGIEATTGRVHWVDTGYEVVSERQVDVRFDLRRDPDRAVVCELEAQNYGHTVVGRTEVTVGPSDSSPSRHVESVETAAAAVTGYVTECWYADEERHD